MSAISHSPGNWQDGFLKVLPAVQTRARIRLRRLGADRRQEAVQETVAAACVNYQLAAARGKLEVVRTGPLADFAVRHARTGRHVGGHQDAARDVMSATARRCHGIDLASVDDDRCHAMLVASGRADVPELAAFRIDFDYWLSMFGPHDRAIIGLLAGGAHTKCVARQFAISAGRVSQLRRRFERHWMMFQGDAPSNAAGMAA